jgi:hypothetical protein
MNEQRFYDESEAREILEFAGGKTQAGDLLSISDLERAAGELGIHPDIVRQAAAKIQNIREDKADRREFRRSRKREIFGLACMPFFIAGLAIVTHDNSLLTVAVMPVLAVASAIQKYFSPSSTDSEIQFQKWRTDRVARCSPELLGNLVDPFIEEHLRQHPTLTEVTTLATYITLKFKMSHEAAMRSIDSYFVRHPEAAAIVEYYRAQRVGR